jgi:hypothetical protein
MRLPRSHPQHCTQSTPSILHNMDAQPGSFLKRWRSLPDELRLQILALTLPAGQRYNVFHFRNPRRLGDASTLQQLDNLVYPLLSISEIKDLVIEA